ncbi:hypothetical protein KY289_014015 [Solanum tuberosum]|nr:hypothetical protein KY289_014015 [Solanum tuberosum]
MAMTVLDRFSGGNDPEVVDLSPVTYSSNLEDAFTSGNTEPDHMLEKLPEKYTNVDSLALLTGSDAEIATLEGLGTPQIGMQNQFCKDISMQTKFPTSVLTDTKESNSVEEKKSLDNAALFDKSPQRDASVYPIATWVSLLIPLVGREDMMSNEHLEQDMATRGFNDQHISSQFPFIPTTNFIMLIVTVPISAVDLCVWDPGIDFGFMALTGYIKRTWRNYYCWDNKCVVARQVVTELNLIMRKSFIVNQKDHGCNLVLSVLVERFGGRRALTTIAQYFEVNNYSIDKSMQLSNNENTMSIVLQVANEVASLLLTNLTIRGDAHAYSNLEDKVLNGVGSIVMNGPRPVLAKRPNTELSGYVWDPG